MARCQASSLGSTHHVQSTDMVLGPGARDRGAECDRIDPSTPGVGFMWCDGEAEPTRFRAGYVTDNDIAQMVEQYRPGDPPPAAVPVDAPEDAPVPPTGGVVIDLADMVGLTS